MENIELELENFFQLKATVKLDAKLYAFYLYLNDEVIARTQYNIETTRTFPLDKAGTYRVKW